MRWLIRCAIAVGIVGAGSGCKTTNKYSTVSAHSMKCLSLTPPYGYYDGDPVVQWECTHIHMTLQKEWIFVPVGTSNVDYQVKSIMSGKCLEVKLSTSTGKNNGDIAQQSKCTGATNQIWNVVTTDAGTTFKSIYSGKCLQVRLGSTGGMNDGDVVEQWDCVVGAKHQIWKLQAASTPPPDPPLDTGAGELCNVCNPQKPECKPGALCIILPSTQSVCGQQCSATKACPSGYTCTQMMKSGQAYFQCVPKNNSCPL